jgi:hypothetical protein
MTNPRRIVLIAVAIAGLGAGALSCGGGDQGPPPGGGPPKTIKLETWMDGLAKNAEVDVTSMPDNVLYTVTDKQPVPAAEAAHSATEPGKVAIVYEEDPSKLQFLIEADPQYRPQP